MTKKIKKNNKLPEIDKILKLIPEIRKYYS